MSKKRLVHAPVRRDWLRRLDRLAADLNIVLVMFAIGLGILDLTFVFSQRLLELLPVTRVVYTDTGQGAPISAAVRTDLR